MYLFVYGTLTSPDRVDTVLAGTSAQYDLRCEATLEGLHRVAGTYPTLAPGGTVEGKLLVVDETGLEALDQYEGVDRGLYTRVAVPRIDEGSGNEPVWVYVGDPDRLEVSHRVTWPEGQSLADRVKSYVSRHDIVVQCDE